MPTFTVFQPYHIIEASQFNDNFSIIGEGDWLPRGGTILDPSTSIYDLGSTSYRWNNLFVNTLNIMGNNNEGYWNLVAEVKVTSPTSRIDITGLNHKLYWIIAELKGDYFGKLYFNYDSGTNYGRLYVEYYAPWLELVNYFTQSAQYLPLTESFNATLYAEPTTEKLFLYTDYLILGSGVWNSTATLTSISFVGDWVSSTVIQIWAAI